MILTIRADHAAPAEEWDGSWSVRYHYAETRLVLGHRLPIINTRVTSQLDSGGALALLLIAW